MTEKIVRRGVNAPDSYEPDRLEKIIIAQVINGERLVLSEENTIGEVREWLESEPDYSNNFFIVTSNTNEFRGIISASNLFSSHHDTRHLLGTLIKRNNISISANDNLRSAAELMAKENIDVLPVVSEESHRNIIGILSYKDVIAAYMLNVNEHARNIPSISLKRRSLKILLKGKKVMEMISRKE
ncbi:MAG: CBS domain-containing protein [Chitinophagaceae bacterium]